MKKIKSIMYDFMNPSPKELMHAIWWIVLANAFTTIALVITLKAVI